MVETTPVALTPPEVKPVFAKAPQHQQADLDQEQLVRTRETRQLRDEAAEAWEVTARVRQEAARSNNEDERVREEVRKAASEVRAAQNETQRAREQVAQLQPQIDTLGTEYNELLRARDQLQERVREKTGLPSIPVAPQQVVEQREPSPVVTDRYPKMRARYATMVEWMRETCRERPHRLLWILGGACAVALLVLVVSNKLQQRRVMRIINAEKVQQPPTR